MAESSPNRQKTLWKKEKLLVTSNFSFSHCVFKRLVRQTRKEQGLFGNGLRGLFLESDSYSLTAKQQPVDLPRSHSCITVVTSERVVGVGRIRNSGECCVIGWLFWLYWGLSLTAKVMPWRSVMHMYFLAFSHQY